MDNHVVAKCVGTVSGHLLITTCWMPHHCHTTASRMGMAHTLYIAANKEAIKLAGDKWHRISRATEDAEKRLTIRRWPRGLKRLDGGKLFTRNVPELQFDDRLLVEMNHLEGKVHAHSALVVGAEDVIGVPIKQTSLLPRSAKGGF